MAHKILVTSPEAKYLFYLYEAFLCFVLWTGTWPRAYQFRIAKNPLNSIICRSSIELHHLVVLPSFVSKNTKSMSTFAHQGVNKPQKQYANEKPLFDVFTFQKIDAKLLLLRQLHCIK